MEPNKFSLREILTAGGVILSLLFVGFELRQNTNAVKATAIQEYASNFREHSALYINDPDMARIITLAMTDFEKLNQEESQRFVGWSYAGTLLAQSAFRQWQLGVLPDEEWSIVVTAICLDRKNTNLDALDKALEPMLVPTFVKAIDDACDEMEMDEN